MTSLNLDIVTKSEENTIVSVVEKSDFVYALVRKARIPKNIMISVLYSVEYT